MTVVGNHLSMKGHFDRHQLHLYFIGTVCGEGTQNHSSMGHVALLPYCRPFLGPGGNTTKGSGVSAKFWELNYIAVTYLCNPKDV